MGLNRTRLTQRSAQILAQWGYRTTFSFLAGVVIVLVANLHVIAVHGFHELTPDFAHNPFVIVLYALPFVFVAIAVGSGRRDDRLAALTESAASRDKRFRDVLDAMAEAVLIYGTDTNLGVTYCNEAGARLHGVSRHDLETRLQPRGLVEYLDSRGNRAVYTELPSIKTFMTAQAHTNEVIGLRRLVDGSISWVIASSAPLRVSANGAYAEEVIVTYTDITDRRALEEQLAQAQKLESIGHLAAGIAHEINTPVQFVGDNTRFVRDSCGDILALLELYDRLASVEAVTAAAPDVLDEIRQQREAIDLDFLIAEIPAALDQSLDGTQRIAEIVRAMKEFSHPGTTEKIPTDLNAAIRSTTTVARNEWKYLAELELELNDSLPLVPCFPGELNQVLLNIIVNAAQAIGEQAESDTTSGPIEGRIRITTARDDDAVVINIADNGPGMPENVRERIFDPFFTTKDVGKGTGQGLAIGRSVIVDKHGGTLVVDSTPGNGTTFTIRLPIDPPLEAAA